MMIPRFLVAALCVLGPLTCVAHGGNINGEATYISFSVPGALGTYPMGINASMTVTGYYYVTPTVTRGFLRDADGTITTFDILGGVWTEPESINAAGDITGYYEVVPGTPHGFLRYADGRTITFDPPDAPGVPGPQSQPVSINEFDEIAGNYLHPLPASDGFTRSRAGVFTTIGFGDGADYKTVVTGLNANGTVVGYGASVNDLFSFISDPDGFSNLFVLPMEEGQFDGTQDTVAESINGDGVIAGWYSLCIDPCATTSAGGFVRSPQGVFTLFNPPGTLVTLPGSGPASRSETLSAPHRLSINQAGDITGSYTDAAGVQHGFVRNPYGTITSFDPPEGNQTTTTSINDGGAIAGFYHYHAGGGPPVGFIRVPQ